MEKRYALQQHLVRYYKQLVLKLVLEVLFATLQSVDITLPYQGVNCRKCYTHVKRHSTIIYLNNWIALCHDPDLNWARTLPLKIIHLIYN